MFGGDKYKVSLQLTAINITNNHALYMGFFVNPVLCEMVARPGDVLQV